MYFILFGLCLVGLYGEYIHSEYIKSLVTELGIIACIYWGASAIGKLGEAIETIAEKTTEMRDMLEDKIANDEMYRETPTKKEREWDF